mmetsp:Transcript_7343/g.9597  ORF Transcript_7343/g.9597 Transcript_7343/m.9597 type:complete len:530 (+) Transcript_7343:353-1942(+)
MTPALESIAETSKGTVDIETDSVSLTSNDEESKREETDSGAKRSNFLTSRSPRKYSFSCLGLNPRDDESTDPGACIGVDFGGTLTKVVFFEDDSVSESAKELTEYVLSTTKYGRTGERDTHLQLGCPRFGGKFHFTRFESSHTEGAVKLLKSKLRHRIQILHGTGGGAHKYKSLFKRELGIDMEPHDELATVVTGIVYILLEHPDTECYTYVQKSGIPGSETSGSMEKVPRPVNVDHLFPLIVVNIGSGVSVLKVDSPKSFARVSGTALGGATYYGLCKLLCLCKNFDEAMDMAELGDSRNVNLLVKDIYGGAYDSIGLSPEHTASFFGKSAASRGTTSCSVKSKGRKSDKEQPRKKKQEVSFWERLGLVVTSILSANLVYTVTEQATGVFDYARAAVLLACPFFLTFCLFYPEKLSLVKDEEKTAPQYEEEHVEFSPEDISRALVVMIAQNVTQIAFLNARLHKSSRVVFTGNFLRHNMIAQRTLSKSMRVWSNGEIAPLFMEHEGYFGAMGSFLYSSGLSPKRDLKD